MRVIRTTLLLASLLLCAGCSEDPEAYGPFSVSYQVGNTTLPHPDLEIVLSGTNNGGAEPVVFGPETFSVLFKGQPFEQSEIAAGRLEWTTVIDGRLETLGWGPTLSAAKLPKAGRYRVSVGLYSPSNYRISVNQRWVRRQVEETLRSIATWISTPDASSFNGPARLSGEAVDWQGVALPDDALVWLRDPHGLRVELGRGRSIDATLPPGVHEVGLASSAPGHANALAWITIEVQPSGTTAAGATTSPGGLEPPGPPRAA